jgi:hypothetical protein
MLLAPISHYDFTSLPADLAGELGRLMVALGAAIETLPSVARVHISKWGDGGAHAHVFLFARPTRMPQLRGTCLALWDGFVPPFPLMLSTTTHALSSSGWSPRLEVPPSTWCPEPVRGGETPESGRASPIARRLAASRLVDEGHDLLQGRAEPARGVNAERRDCKAEVLERTLRGRRDVQRVQVRVG